MRLLYHMNRVRYLILNQIELMLKRKVYQFIIHSRLHDVIYKSNELYLDRFTALDEADKLNKEHFKEMIGNFYTTKEFTVVIKSKKDQLLK